VALAEAALMDDLAAWRFSREDLLARCRDSAPCTDEVDARVQSDIQRHGWHVVLVPPEQDSPGWAHTIGLWERYRHPELLVFGSEPRVLTELLNTLGERVRGGRRSSPESEGSVLQGLLRFRASRRAGPTSSRQRGWHYRANFEALRASGPTAAAAFRGTRAVRARSRTSSRSSKSPSFISRAVLAALRRERAAPQAGPPAGAHQRKREQASRPSGAQRPSVGRSKPALRPARSERREKEKRTCESW
jgi:hypothetical protein